MALTPKVQKKFAIVLTWVPLFLVLSSSNILRGAKQNEIAHETVGKELYDNNGRANYTEPTGLRGMNISMIESEALYETGWENSQRERGEDTYEKMFRFCRDAQVSVTRKGLEPPNQATDEGDFSLSLLYQCSGDPYANFAKRLQRFAESCPTTHKNMTFPWKRREEDICSAFVPSFPLASASNQSLHHPLWGKREFPLPDNITVLAIGNSHLRQISKTIACQYAHKLTNIHILPKIGELTTANNSSQGENNNNNRTTTNVESFVIEFSNHARWISITNRVLFYSKEWNELIEEFYLKALRPSEALQSSQPLKNRQLKSLSLKDMDAIVLGKFTTYEQAKGTNFERTMKDEEESYYNFYRHEYDERKEEESTNSTRIRRRRRLKRSGTKRKNGTNSKKSNQSWNEQISINDDIDVQKTKPKTRTVSFATIPPPDMLDVARAYSRPIISLSMFSKSDEARVLSSYSVYREQCLLADRRQHQTRNNSSVVGSTADSSNTSYHDVINNKLYMINGRRYIEEMGIECGTDDKNTMGTCHESPKNITLESTAKKRYRDPSDMHRCAGSGGGHADLVSWDVIEGLYSTTTARSSTR
eukprot:jgi/Psemu1/286825/fgenesh1_pg.156_\